MIISRTSEKSPKMRHGASRVAFSDIFLVYNTDIFGNNYLHKSVGAAEGSMILAVFKNFHLHPTAVCDIIYTVAVPRLFVRARTGEI